MNPALSNHLWLSWRLDHGERERVCSITDGPEKDDDVEGTRGRNPKKKHGVGFIQGKERRLTTLFGRSVID